MRPRFWLVNHWGADVVQALAKRLVDHFRHFLIGPADVAAEQSGEPEFRLHFSGVIHSMRDFAGEYRCEHCLRTLDEVYETGDECDVTSTR